MYHYIILASICHWLAFFSHWAKCNTSSQSGRSDSTNESLRTERECLLQSYAYMQIVCCQLFMWLMCWSNSGHLSRLYIYNVACYSFLMICLFVSVSYSMFNILVFCLSVDKESRDTVCTGGTFYTLFWQTDMSLDNLSLPRYSTLAQRAARSIRLRGAKFDIRWAGCLFSMNTPILCEWPLQSFNEKNIGPFRRPSCRICRRLVVLL
jgi:hypothetical protein